MFLRMKSWQVFTIVAVVPFVAQIILVSFVATGNIPDPRALLSIFPYLMAIFMSVFMTWFWSLGTGLNKLVSLEIRPSSKFFRFGIIYTGAYTLLFTVIMLNLLESGNPGGKIILIVPFHFLAMFCMFYGIYFIAKNLVMAEKNAMAKFDDFAGPFFLLWFFPVGIWIVQPRINKLVAVKT